MISYTTRVSIPSGRTKILDILLPQALNINLITVSCGGSDPEWEIFLDKDVNDLTLMSTPALTTTTTGGTIEANIKVYVRVTTVDATGVESPPTVGAKFITTGSGSTNKVTVNWSAITGAQSYRIYAGSRPGMEVLVGEVASGTTTYLITSMPDLATEAPNKIPTVRDISVIGKRNGVEPLPLGGGGISINYRIIVYVTVQTAADPAFTLLAS